MIVKRNLITCANNKGDKSRSLKHLFGIVKTDGVFLRLRQSQASQETINSCMCSHET